MKVSRKDMIRTYSRRFCWNCVEQFIRIGSWEIRF